MIQRHRTRRKPARPGSSSDRPLVQFFKQLAHAGGGRQIVELRIVLRFRGDFSVPTRIEVRRVDDPGGHSHAVGFVHRFGGATKPPRGFSIPEEQHAIRDFQALPGHHVVCRRSILTTGGHFAPPGVCDGLLGPIPFLWVVPLSLYLLTFIICFEHERWYARICALWALLALPVLFLTCTESRLQGQSFWIDFELMMHNHVEPLLNRLTGQKFHLSNIDLTPNFIWELGWSFSAMFIPSSMENTSGSQRRFS